MNLKIAIDTHDLNRESTYFLRRTSAGKILWWGGITAFSVLFFYMAIGSGLMQINSSLDFAKGFLLTWICTFLFVTFYYWYMNNGGDISYWFRSEQIREFSIDKNSNTLFFGEVGSATKTKEYSISQVKLDEYRGSRFWVIGNRVFIAERNRVVEGNLDEFEKLLFY